MTWQIIAVRWTPAAPEPTEGVGSADKASLVAIGGGEAHGDEAGQDVAAEPSSKRRRK